MGKLTGKTALITGALQGIGEGIARTFARHGANLILLDISPEIEKLADELCGRGHRCTAVVADVRDPASVAAAIKRAKEKEGRIDILVNNAGITKDKLVSMMKAADFDAVIDTNLKGAFYMTKGVYPLFLKQKGGKIINISSVSGLTGNPGQANYSASKAGVIGLTKSVAKELASRGVCCNAIAPGFIATEMTQALENDTLKDAIPMKRFGEAEEVAKLALFLASEHSDYITGEVIRIDGGLAC